LEEALHLVLEGHLIGVLVQVALAFQIWYKKWENMKKQLLAFENTHIQKTKITSLDLEWKTVSIFVNITENFSILH
jgi:hypothetical protein